MNVDKWTLNESLLQSYRGIFIGSQSFLLAVGAMFAQTPKLNWALVGLALLSVYVIWRMWFPIVPSRARIVDYYKFKSDSAYDSAFEGITEDDYVRNDDVRESVNSEICKNNWRETRRKVDIGLPVIFTIIWTMLIYSYFIA